MQIGPSSNKNVHGALIKTLKELDEKFLVLLTKLNVVATECISKSSGHSTRTPNPWLNDDCKDAIKARQKALDKCRAQPPVKI